MRFYNINYMFFVVGYSSSYILQLIFVIQRENIRLIGTGELRNMIIAYLLMLILNILGFLLCSFVLKRNKVVMGKFESLFAGISSFWLFFTMLSLLEQLVEYAMFAIVPLITLFSCLLIIMASRLMFWGKIKRNRM